MEVDPEMSARRTVSLSIAEQFSRDPVGRIDADSDYNGTRFREEHLAPALRKLSATEHLEVSFDGLEGAGSSFLEEAFGGLVRVERMAASFLDSQLLLSTTEHGLQDTVRLAREHINSAAKHA